MIIIPLEESSSDTERNIKSFAWRLPFAFVLLLKIGSDSRVADNDGVISQAAPILREQDLRRFVDDDPSSSVSSARLLRDRKQAGCDHR